MRACIQQLGVDRARVQAIASGASAAQTLRLLHGDQHHRQFRGRVCIMRAVPAFLHMRVLSCENHGHSFLAEQPSMPSLICEQTACDSFVFRQESTSRECVAPSDYAPPCSACNQPECTQINVPGRGRQPT